jgi:hypothetical protein
LLEEKFKGLEEKRKHALEMAQEENKAPEASTKSKQNVICPISHCLECPKIG